MIILRSKKFLFSAFLALMSFSSFSFSADTYTGWISASGYVAYGTQRNYSNLTAAQVNLEVAAYLNDPTNTWPHTGATCSGFSPPSVIPPQGYFGYSYCSGSDGFSGTAAMTVFVASSTPDCNIPSGTEYNFAGSGTAPNSGCYNSCTFNISASVTLSSGGWGGSGKSTGQSCSPDNLTGGLSDCPVGQWHDYSQGGLCVPVPKCSTNPAISAFDVNCGASTAPKCAYDFSILATDPNCKAPVTSPTPAGSVSPSSGSAINTASGSMANAANAAGTAAPVNTGAGAGVAPNTTLPDFVGSMDSAGVQTSVKGYVDFYDSQLKAVQNVPRDEFSNERTWLGQMSDFVQLGSITNQCNQITFGILSASKTINICPYTEFIRSILEWLMAVFGSWTVFRIITQPRA